MTIVPRLIREDDVVASIADALQYIAVYHPPNARPPARRPSFTKPKIVPIQHRAPEDRGTATFPKRDAIPNRHDPRSVGAFEGRPA